MPLITKITSQKDKNRVNVYLDGKFGFGVDLENFLKLKLKVGGELSSNEIETIRAKSEYSKILERLLRYSSLRPRSEHEINFWFKRKDVAEDVRVLLKNKLMKLGLLNDEAFASWWVSQRQQFRPKAIRVLNQELKIKGISDEIRKHTLENIKVDERKIASDLLKKRAYKWENLDKKTARVKIAAYLARKGFTWSIIKSAIDEHFD